MRISRRLALLITHWLTGVVIDKLIKHFGSQRKLAAAVGVTAQSVTKWKRNGIPAARVLELERLSGISRHEMRPDIFGACDAAA